MDLATNSIRITMMPLLKMIGTEVIAVFLLIPPTIFLLIPSAILIAVNVFAIRKEFSMKN